LGGPRERYEIRVEVPMRGDVETVEALTRVVLLRAEGGWVAVAQRAGAWVVIARSPEAAPLVASLRAEGYSVRFAFAWNKPEQYLREAGDAAAGDHAG
jgi:hypothetical protein